MTNWPQIRRCDTRYLFKYERCCFDWKSFSTIEHQAKKIGGWTIKIQPLNWNNTMNSYLSTRAAACGSQWRSQRWAYGRTEGRCATGTGVLSVLTAAVAVRPRCRNQFNPTVVLLLKHSEQLVLLLLLLALLEPRLRQSIEDVSWETRATWRTVCPPDAAFDFTSSIFSTRASLIQRLAMAWQWPWHESWWIIDPDTENR